MFFTRDESLDDRHWDSCRKVAGTQERWLVKRERVPVLFREGSGELVVSVVVKQSDQNILQTFVCGGSQSWALRSCAGLFSEVNLPESVPQ